MVLADPTGSVLYEYVKTGKLVNSGSWAVEGIGEDFVPDIADMSFVTEAYEIDDEESFATARELLRQEGILGGSSTGTLVAGAHCAIAVSKPSGNASSRSWRQRQQISLQDV